MVIYFKNVKKEFTKSDGKVNKIFKSLSLHIRKGEFCCIIGASGIGKTTILNMIAGLTEPSYGEVIKENLSRVGYVFQTPRLLAWKSVKDNIRLVLKAKSIKGEEQEEIIQNYLRLIGLNNWSKEYPDSLSEGMKQRVALARALAINPDILLMDEPFSNIDDLTAKALRKELVKIWMKKKKTIVFVTHNIQEAIYLADRIILLDNKNPTEIKKIFEIRLKRPRSYRNKELFELEKKIIPCL